MRIQLPSRRGRAVIAALERGDFYLHHVEGSHHVLRHPAKRRHVASSSRFIGAICRQARFGASSSRRDSPWMSSSTCSDRNPEFGTCPPVSQPLGMPERKTSYLSTYAAETGDGRDEMAWSRQLPGPSRRAGRRRVLGCDRPWVSAAPVRFAIQAEQSTGRQARIRGW